MTFEHVDNTDADFLASLFAGDVPEERSYTPAWVTELTGAAQAALDKALKGLDGESRSVCEEYAFLWGLESTFSISGLHRLCVAAINHRNDNRGPTDEFYMRAPTRTKFKHAVLAMQMFRKFSEVCNYRTTFGPDDISCLCEFNPYEFQLFKEWAKSQFKSSELQVSSNVNRGM